MQHKLPCTVGASDLWNKENSFSKQEFWRFREIFEPYEGMQLGHMLSRRMFILKWIEVKIGAGESLKSTKTLG